MKITTLLFLSIYSLCLCVPCFLEPHDTLPCILINVTGPVKTGHVGTKYTLLLNESYLVTIIEYFHSVFCIKKPEEL